MGPRVRITGRGPTAHVFRGVLAATYCERKEKGLACCLHRSIGAPLFLFRWSVGASVECGCHVMCERWTACITHDMFTSRWCRCRWGGPALLWTHMVFIKRHRTNDHATESCVSGLMIYALSIIFVVPLRGELPRNYTYAELMGINERASQVRQQGLQVFTNWTITFFMTLRFALSLFFPWERRKTLRSCMERGRSSVGSVVFSGMDPPRCVLQNLATYIYLATSLSRG
jgi:hypothetical protein